MHQSAPVMLGAALKTQLLLLREHLAISQWIVICDGNVLSKRDIHS